MKTKLIALAVLGAWAGVAGAKVKVPRAALEVDDIFDRRAQPIAEAGPLGRPSVWYSNLWTSGHPASSGISFRGALRLTEEHHPVSVTGAEILVHLAPNVHDLVVRALDHEELTVSVEPPDQTRMGAVILKGRFGVRPSWTRLLLLGLAGSNERVQRTLRLPLRLDGIPDGPNRPALTFHSGAKDARLGDDSVRGYTRRMLRRSY